jgi:hypothetical protein
MKARPDAENAQEILDSLFLCARVSNEIALAPLARYARRRA